MSKIKLHVDVSSIPLESLHAKNELVFALPFLNAKQMQYFFNHVLNSHEMGRFSSVFTDGSKHIELTTVEKCDYVLLPFKWRTTELNQTDGRSSAEPYIKLAKEHGKKLLVLFEDDYSGKLNLKPDEGIVLRTSFYRSQKQNNEFALPVFRCDRFSDNFITQKPDKPTVGFCGFFNTEKHKIRKYALHKLEIDERIDSDYIIRESFWAQGIDKSIAVSDHYNNVVNNMFTLCSRGAGNHSMRLYEVLSMGRIPIQVDTDCVYPFDNVIDWEKHCIIVPEKEINNICNIVMDFYTTKSSDELLQMQIENRNVWKKYLSPLGFVEHVKEAFYDSSN